MYDERSDRVLLRVAMIILSTHAGVVIRAILNVSTGSQCTSSSSGFACGRLGAWSMILSSLFCTSCRFYMVPEGAHRSTT